MSQYTVNIYLTNQTGGEAYLQMSHMSKGKKATTGCWVVPPNVSGGPLVVTCDTDEDDYWYCSASVMDGPNVGIYASQGTLMTPTKKCTLQSSESGKDIYNTVSNSTFSINNSSATTGMKYKGWHAQVTNIFVLMLENHSFDHLFGFADLPNMNGLTGDETNTISRFGEAPGTYQVSTPAVDPMPFGPPHEFADTLVQLCQTRGIAEYRNGVYPPIDNGGFAAAYAYKETVPAEQVGNIMACCDPPTQIPVLYELAQNFLLCDNWFSSMPGPTWPNRLFAMGASSVGLDDSPTQDQILGWESIDGLNYPNGSIFDKMNASTKDYKWRIYADTKNQFNPDGVNYASGQFPIAGGLEDIKLWDIQSFWNFEEDVQGKYPYQFTWIEPNYGDASGDFSGGSSQHPTDSLTAGECLIAATYNAIRSSPYWATSILIVTYDEHGGFYDHVAPGAATPPGDNPNPSLSTEDFNFAQLGVRVPAVVISPLVYKGVVEKTEYNHASIAKLVLNHWSLGNLTATDLAANDPGQLLAVSPPRTNAPDYIKPPKAPKKPTTTQLESVTPPDTRPLPDKGNIIGFLHIALKAEADMSDGSEAAKQAILANFKATVHTYADAKAYFERIAAAVDVLRVAKRAAATAAAAAS